MRHFIPNAALDDRLFFGGTAGSGKTYNAMGCVERLLKGRARVVIPDPLGVWWGLRLGASGKNASGYDVVIFGAPHGDLPLTEHAGALIGETVAGMKESCILDLSELGTKAAERRFMLAFLTALYKHASGEPLHVVFDEADMWAPQRLLDKEGEAAKLLGMMETIVRRGRIKGFIPWLISQRPAVISKDVLSQADGIVAFKLTSSQDRDAIGDWVQGQADKKTWAEIWSRLPTMERGQGVVWLPGRGVLETVQFPVKETFDSSRTPKRGEHAHRTAVLRPIDLGKVKERLATVEAEVKANDPRALRIENAKLKSEIQKLSAAKSDSNRPDPDAIKKAEERGFEQAKKKLAGAAQREAKAVLMAGTTALRSIIGRFTTEIDEEVKKLRADLADVGAAVTFAPSPTLRPVQAVSPKTPMIGRAAPIPRPSPPAGDGTYTRPQIRVLRSLAMWKSLGHDAPSREMVAAGAGYAPGSGGFNNLIGGLSTAGALMIPTAGCLTLAADNIDTPTIDDGRAALLSVLSNPHKKFVAALNGTGPMTRDALAEATGYAPGSGGFNNLIGKLNTLGISYVPMQGHVALSDWAQELFSGYEVRATA